MMFPKFCIVTRFPSLHGEVGEVLCLPGGIAKVGGIGHAHAASSLHIAEDVVSLLSAIHFTNGQARTGNGDALRTSSTEAEGGLSVRDLILLPPLAIVPHQAILRHLTIGIAPIDGNVRKSLSIGRHARLVNQFTTLGNGAGNLGISHGDGECVCFARRLCPRASTIG